MISFNDTQIKPKNLNYHDDLAVCHWTGDGLSGRIVSLYEKKPGVYLQIGKHLTSPENHPEIESCLDLVGKVVQGLVEAVSQDLSEYNLSPEEYKKIYNKVYVNYRIDAHVPSIVKISESQYVIQDIDAEIIHKWVLQEKTVSLLKKGQSLIWRVTSGKVHKISLGHFKFVCLFPKANPSYSVNQEWINTNGYPYKLPGLVGKVDPDFFKAHSLDKLKEEQQCTVLEFTPNYPKIKSKFNPEVFVTPYDWGITLISYTADSINSNLVDPGNGHSALVIERVKGGKYYAEKMHIVRWSQKINGVLQHRHNIDYGEDAAYIGLMEPYFKKSVLDGYIYPYLKDETVSSAQECFKNLQYSPTWIRKRESVDNMLKQVRALYDLQERSKSPVFSFYYNGDNKLEHKSLFVKSLAGGIGGLAIKIGFPVLSIPVLSSLAVYKIFPVSSWGQAK